MLSNETAQRSNIAEQSMLLAFRAFGAWPDDPAWLRLSGAWREALEPARTAVGRRFDAPAARRRLVSQHSAEALFDPFRIHPTWWIRALKRESPAVRRAVAAFEPAPVGPALRRAFDYVVEGPSLMHPPHAEAIAWTRALWHERLVGGPVHRDDDPPIVRAIAALDRRGHYVLISTLGLAKLAFASPDLLRRDRDRCRAEVLRPSLPTARLELIDLAMEDIEEARRSGGDRPPAARIGLGSLARLLSGAEPHRARWALQHLPYEVSRWVGPRMNRVATRLSPDDVLGWELALFRAAVVVLVHEGRIDPVVLTGHRGAGPGGRP